MISEESKTELLSFMKIKGENHFQFPIKKGEIYFDFCKLFEKKKYRELILSEIENVLNKNYIKPDVIVTLDVGSALFGQVYANQHNLRYTQIDLYHLSNLIEKNVLDRGINVLFILSTLTTGIQLKIVKSIFENFETTNTLVLLDLRSKSESSTNRDNFLSVLSL
jgi:hypothetical protein